ncbi:MAG: hypothetical protein ABSC48_10220 [Terracidiphilus sp.]|jgi:hypothetical protein
MKIATVLTQGILSLRLPAQFSNTASPIRSQFRKTKAVNANIRKALFKAPLALFATRLSRGFACASILCGILMLLSTPASAQGVSVAAMPPCSADGGPNGGYGSTLDLSTTSNSVVTDPYWTINGGPAYHITAAQVASMYSFTVWTPDANWLQPNPSPLPDGSAAAGIYIYEIHFRIPECALETLSLSGSYLVDDYVQDITLNGHHYAPFNSGYPLYCNLHAGCFAGTPTAFSFTNPADFVAGVNTLRIRVRNLELWTGLEVNATLTSTCANAQCGNVKLCKVAGPGVAASTPFTFNYSSIHGSGTASIPAGPAPGGYCKLSGSAPIGTVVHLAEVLPAGDIVSSITAAPPSSLGATNLSAGTATVTVGTGVTEVTYTDENQKEETGYLEICKEYKGNSTTAPPPFATFNITPGSSGPVVVPAGACSPAIEVPAGTVTITEVPIVGYAMNTCATIPAADQISCVPATWTDTVTVAPGNIPNQTVAIITNSPANTTGGGGTTGFTLTTSAASLTIVPGAVATATITVTPGSAFDGSVTLAASGLPSGVFAAFDTNPTTGTSTLTLSAGSAATAGESTVTITGTSDAQTATTSIDLTVSASATGTSFLEFPLWDNFDPFPSGI